MGKDFCYNIVRRGKKIPKEEDYDDSEQYWDAFRKFYHNFTDMPYGRNQWDGPYSNDTFSDGGFTQDEMIESLKNYVKYLDTHNYNVRFTLKAFGRIIAEMDDDQVVYIKYG